MLRTQEHVERRHRGRQDRAQVASPQTKPERENGPRNFTSQKPLACVHCKGNFA